MTKKGPSMHHTVTHKSKNASDGPPPATSGGKPDEQANAAILLAPQAIFKSQADSRPPVTPQTSNTALSLLQLRGADYCMPFAGMCQDATPAYTPDIGYTTSDECHDALPALWIPSKGYGGQGF